MNTPPPTKPKSAPPKKTKYLGSSTEEEDHQEIPVRTKSKISPAKKHKNKFLQSDEEDQQEIQRPKKVPVPRAPRPVPKMCQKCKNLWVSYECKSMECAQKKWTYLCGDCDKKCHQAPSTMDHVRERIWGWALTHTLSRITLSKVSFSDLLGRNDFLDHPDPFEQIFDFHNF